MTAPRLIAARLTYEQDPDGDDPGGVQELRVEVTDAGAGPYLVIRTRRWAFDSPEQLVAVLEDAVRLARAMEEAE